MAEPSGHTGDPATRRRELLIWDFDGTVADTHAAIMGAAGAAFRSLGYDVELGSAGTKIGLPLTELFRHVIPDADDELLSRLTIEYRKDFKVNGPARSRVFPGVMDLIGELRRVGVRSALATARKRPSLDPLLESLGLAGCFDPVLTNGEVEHPKPHPEMLLVVCADVGVEPVEAMMIGDTTFDMEMGRSAGTTTSAVTWGNHSGDVLATSGSDFLVESVPELRSLLLE